MSMTSSPANETKRPESALIVGAGIIGATTALYLAREGVAVTLVDRHHAGWGASGRNAGYISMITRFAGPQLDLAQLSRKLYPLLADEIDDFEFQANGALVYYYDGQFPFIEGFVERRQADGLPMEIVDGDRARELFPLLPDEVVGGIHSKSDCFVHPGKLVDALVAAAEKDGAQVVQANVVGLEVADGRCVGVRPTPAFLTLTWCP